MHQADERNVGAPDSIHNRAGPVASSSSQRIRITDLPEVLLDLSIYTHTDIHTHYLTRNICMHIHNDGDLYMQDVHQHILSVMTMRDAARAACASRRFLSYWRCYPNLSFNQEALAAHRQLSVSSQYRGKYVFNKTRHVLENHSGHGVKTLKLNLSICSKTDIDVGLLDCWLRTFVKPGTTELTVMLPKCYALEYSFPYSFLSWDEEFGSTIESLHLASCGFHPEEGPRLLGFSRSLLKVCLHNVEITEDELGFFLSSSFSLERLDMSSCNMITSLKIPRVLHKLRIVRLHMCRALQTFESNAPNLSTINYDRLRLLSFSLGDRLEAKKLLIHSMCMEDMLQYAGGYLPSIAPNLETLVLSTGREVKPNICACLDTSS